MKSDDAYRRAEEKIEEARRSGATELDLSWDYANFAPPKLTELPESVGQLAQLQKLDLYSNNLKTLPESLGQLAQLQTLDLSGNKLTTTPEWLGQLTQLQTLDLSDNKLATLSESMGQLARLQTLRLGGNSLTILQEWLGQLSQLRTLNLSNNELTTLPESLGHLARLQVLDLGGNRLATLPAWVGQLSQLQTLDLTRNQLTKLPKSIGQLAQLQTLDLSINELTTLPESLGQLSALVGLQAAGNELSDLPDSIGRLRNLRVLSVAANQFVVFPRSVCECRSLQSLGATGNSISELPKEIGNLKQLKYLLLGGPMVIYSPNGEFGLIHQKYGGSLGNSLSSLPTSLLELSCLEMLTLENNPLNPELAAAYDQGLDAVKAYLRAKAEEQIVLNEAKLILIGEGEVGKTSLLGALRGDPWVENRKTTHGVEVDIKSFVLSDSDTNTEITFNGWDFGGQNIYRPTHQLFFTAPAIYLAVWNPRRGPEVCKVDDWIKMVKHRAHDEMRPDDRPRILVVATHGGPKERLDHIDEQLLREEFGNLLVGFYHVDSKTGNGLEKLKQAIAHTAAAVPSVGRSVPKSWKDMLDALRNRSEKDAYISYDQFRAVCHAKGVEDELADTYAAILNELGHLIHYRGDADLQDTVILKPEWLSKAISYVLEDETTKETNGLVECERLSEIWHDPDRPETERYPKELHPVFLKLMEQFDLSYRVAMPKAGTPETSLIAQLVPGGRPDGWEQDWPPEHAPGDAERRQVCRIVDAETGRTAEVEGLVYRLIVRLHRYSLGRDDYFKSRHWKTGMILDDDFNGRAFLEEIAGDIHVTVRAAYPDRFLTHLCSEIDWLVEHFWKGLDCRQSIPCHPPCKGLHEVKALIETKREGIPKVRCPVCEKFYAINSLLAAVAPKPRLELVLEELKKGQKEIKQGVAAVGSDLKKLISLADEQFVALMTALIDEAKEGPRLFSFEPVDPGFWDKPKWIAEKFRLTLWCEHCRLPLTHPELNGGEAGRGIYDVELTRDWIKKSAPFLKVLSGTLSLALPIASSAAKQAMDATAYEAIENQLDFGKTCAESFLEAGEKVGDWLTSDDETTLDSPRGIRADGVALRELHALLKVKDPANRFGGLVRVQNKRRQFLWVHEQYASQY